MDLARKTYGCAVDPDPLRQPVASYVASYAGTAAPTCGTATAHDR